ncbi:MAG: hypothetical protein M1142_03910 [Patescibacteria group bacterium]|nr:hypothetical protein [Patescibacteria group bacterium]
MVEDKHDPFAPDYKLQHHPDFKRRIALVQECLFRKYFDAHQHHMEKEKREFCDGFAWAGPMRFALPVQFVYDYIPNLRVLQSVEDALCNICKWPNARRQAFQLKECIKYGGEAGLYAEVAQIGDLVAKIARKKPYGKETVGTDLLSIGWSEVYFNSNFGQGKDINGLFKLIISDLTDFADGKYQHCIKDYPFGLFYRLKNDNFLSSISPESRSDTSGAS